MDFLVNLAQSFIGLFELGGETLMSWVTGIIPKVLLLLVFMNALIALIGEDKVNRFGEICSKNKILAYGVLPFVSAFMLGNPMALSMGKFLPEFQKPSYYASGAYHCHTNNGIFPHINPGELFVWLGIAQGVEALGLSTVPLAIRYMLVGIVMNFFAGYITDFTTRYVEKQQNIKLKRTMDVEANNG